MLSVKEIIMKRKPTPLFYSITLLILFWQGLAMLIDYPELFPSVTALVVELFSLFGNQEFYVALWHTVVRGLAGFLLATCLAISLATIALRSSFWKSFFQPWIVVIRSIPVISIVLIALLWLSPPGLPVFIAFFTMFPILYQNILSGLEHTDSKLVEMAKVYRKNNFQRLKYIYIPAARKYIFAGMATAMGFGWRAVIIGEVLAGPLHGIGTSMKKAQAFIDMRELLAYTVVAIVVSFIFDWLLKLIDKNTQKFHLSVSKNANTASVINADIKTLNINNLNKAFNNKLVIHNYSDTLSNDHIHILKSASGSGKTTLLQIIAGLLKKDSGKISFNHTGSVYAYSFQDKRIIPWLTTEQNIAFALPHFPYLTDKDTHKINQLINLLDLNDHAVKFPDELSGGEQQRIALARALILPCHILLLDEPLNGLGQAMKINLIKLIEDWTASYKPLIIWATHEDVEEHLGGGVRDTVLY